MLQHICACAKSSSLKLSDQFLRRFNDCPVPMRRVSQATGKAPAHLGNVLFIGQIRWFSETEAEMPAGWGNGGMTYRVEKKDNHWRGIGAKGVWISENGNRVSVADPLHQKA